MAGYPAFSGGKAAWWSMDPRYRSAGASRCRAWATVKVNRRRLRASGIQRAGSSAGRRRRAKLVRRRRSAKYTGHTSWVAAVRREMVWNPGRRLPAAVADCPAGAAEVVGPQGGGIAFAAVVAAAVCGRGAARPGRYLHAAAAGDALRDSVAGHRDDAAGSCSSAARCNLDANAGGS